jgi:hypothetical protein
MVNGRDTAAAKHLAALRAAAAKPGYASWSTGPTTQEGKRRVSANATRHGAGSLAVRLVLAYAESVRLALLGPLLPGQAGAPSESRAVPKRSP